jgi:translation initiation factor 1A
MKSERTCSKTKTTLRETFQFKNAEQVYGRVTNILGDGLFRCVCDDSLIRVCRIRGNMRNRVYVCEDNIVLIDLLVDLAESENKGIISVRYTDEFVQQLIAHGQITQKFVNKNFDTTDDDASNGFEFV